MFLPVYCHLWYSHMFYCFPFPPSFFHFLRDLTLKSVVNFDSNCNHLGLTWDIFLSCQPTTSFTHEGRSIWQEALPEYAAMLNHFSLHPWKVLQFNWDWAIDWILTPIRVFFVFWCASLPKKFFWFNMVAYSGSASCQIQSLSWVNEVGDNWKRKVSHFKPGLLMVGLKTAMNRHVIEVRNWVSNALLNWCPIKAGARVRPGVKVELPQTRG